MAKQTRASLKVNKSFFWTAEVSSWLALPYDFLKCDFYPCAEIKNLKVPDDYFFVLGDNRARSNDSRIWPGTFLPKEEIIGRAYYRFWPFRRIGPL